MQVQLNFRNSLQCSAGYLKLLYDKKRRDTHIILLLNVTNIMKTRNKKIAQHSKRRPKKSSFRSEMLPRLFEKFASKSCKGTGLGLFICKNIVEAHGGGMWAQNNANGKGATFTFSLPIAEQIASR